MSDEGSASLLKARRTASQAKLDELRPPLATAEARLANKGCVYLTGSYARGEPSKHSDIDLILVKQTKQRFLDRYEGLLQDLFLALPGALVYTPDEFEAMHKTRFLARTVREGKVIYESE